LPASTSAASRFGISLEKTRLRILYFQLLRKLKPNACCDIGCNDGQAALLAKDAAPAAAIYAFEANPEIYQLHHGRLAAAGIHHFHLAVSDCRGEVNVFAPITLSKMWVDGALVEAAIAEPADTGKTSLLQRVEEATYREFKVPAQSLDGFFRDTGRNVQQSTFALWIDVEGAAAAVLAGAESVLASTAALFIELENFPFWKNQRTAGYVADFLEERGFVAIARDREFGDDQFNVVFLHRASMTRAGIILAHPGYPERELPVYIPSFNNPTYLRGMTEQLTRIGLGNIVVVDNGSEFPPQVELLRSLEQRFRIIRPKTNPGPRYFFRNAEFYAGLPQHFCITDPDLEFNPALPADFVKHLIDLTERHRIGKAGFATDISQPELMHQQQFQIGEERCHIWEWEAQSWQNPIATEDEETIYRARIDTTFAIYNKAFFDPADYLAAIRVAGPYTSRHLPWYRDHRLPADEEAFYCASSKHSFYRGTPPSS
jgi:FkbM family methyltransferase